MVALHLFIAGSFRVNLNELFAGQGIEDYKGFLRMHFGREARSRSTRSGSTGRRRWVPAADASAHTPWLDPAKPLTPKLIEEPIKISA